MYKNIQPLDMTVYKIKINEEIKGRFTQLKQGSLLSYP